jgi:adenine-specific DNA methylase
MQTETFKATVSSAYGESLPKAIAVTGSFDAFESYDELKGANELPSNDEVVAFVNAKRKANARAKATTEALEAAGISKPDPNSPDVLKSSMIKNLMKLKGLDEATATQIVSGLMGA